MTWPQITADVADCGSARTVWDHLHPPSLFSTSDAGEYALADPLDAARMDVERWEKSDFRFLTFRDVDYPVQLRDVHEVPPVLFTRGTFKPDERAVSVVGSRAASAAGLRLAAAVARGLVERRITVLSGLAAGIDTVAHTTALEAKGRTVAVIGTGINRSYPTENKGLQQQIADTGLVISQFWPDAPPTKHSFPMRNATMSAYGSATIVIEAGETSGARIQARLAVAHGRPVILTDAVVQGTKWGRSLVGKPGVTWAHECDEIVERAEEAANMSDHVAQLLAIAGGYDG